MMSADSFCLLANVTMIKEQDGFNQVKLVDMGFAHCLEQADLEEMLCQCDPEESNQETKQDLDDVSEPLETVEVAADSEATKTVGNKLPATSGDENIGACCCVQFSLDKYTLAQQKQRLILKYLLLNQSRLQSSSSIRMKKIAYMLQWSVTAFRKHRSCALCASVYTGHMASNWALKATGHIFMNLSL